MPRKPRIHVPGAFYHVTLRGNHRQDIFFVPGDRELFEQISADVIGRFQARIHAYCWMNNHVHLLIQVGDVPLGRLILRIASRYARTVQARLDTTGHLFERRYHALMIDADAYLLEVLRYIHLNPVRARLVEKPAEYSCSSHLDYLGTRRHPWVTTDFALRMFHTERKRATAAYRRFIDAALHESTDFEEALRTETGAGVLGGDDFLGKLRNDCWTARSGKTLARLIDEACQQFEVTHLALGSSRRLRHLARVRAWIAYQAVTLRIASLSQVARAFGRTESSLRESVKHHFDYP
jgi:REP element-mobilizing transposase RayT